jgi:hypothetical protein
MNERIKELWEKAAKLETDPSWEGQTKFMEKFAELIVRGCIDVASNAKSLEAAVMIKQHFGVEE